MENNNQWGYPQQPQNYQTPQGYYVEDADVEAFDRAFPPKEKLRLPGQIF